MIDLVKPVSVRRQPAVAEVVFPKIDANITEGLLVRWLKREGDLVHQGEPLVEITTDKANFELESEHEGTLQKILAPIRSTVPVGYVLALIGPEAGDISEVLARNERILAEHRAQMLVPDGEAETAPVTRQRVRATPAARRLAREHDLDLSTLSTPGGGPVIREPDVRRALQDRPTSQDVNNGPKR